jgi:hypothetical protein
LLLTACVSVSNAQSYHDNEIIIDPIKNNNSSFSVNDLAITNGQDPDGYNYKGMQVPINNGIMNFKVGRKSSNDVAQWFSNYVKDDQNTFNSEPNDLNFAFKGDLTLGDRQFGFAPPYTFKDIVLAQEGNYYLFRNRWWLGGEHCSFIGDSKISCEGTDKNKKKLNLILKRGSDGLSENTVSILNSVSPSDWMGELPNKTTLNKLVIPGSHDAGMSQVSHCTYTSIMSPIVKTQSNNIEEQANFGSRYFDLRIDYDHGQLVTYHRDDDGTGCNGEELQTIMNGLVDFLNSHPTETIILKFSHTRNDVNATLKQDEITQKVVDLLSTYENHFYHENSQKNQALANQELGEFRGKIIAVFDNEYSSLIKDSSYLLEYNEYSGSADGLSVYDEYSGTNDFQAMEEDQLNKLASYMGFGKDRLFLLSWTLTPQSPEIDWKYCIENTGECYEILNKLSVKTLADTANGGLISAMEENLEKDDSLLPNIVYIDFLNKEIGASIINYNILNSYSGSVAN